MELFGISEKLESFRSTVTPIKTFCEQVQWIFQNPLGTFKVVLGGLCEVSRFAAMIVCATAILMYIFGNEKALKYVPTSIVIFLVLKVMVSVL